MKKDVVLKDIKSKASSSKWKTWLTDKAKCGTCHYRECMLHVLPYGLGLVCRPSSCAVGVHHNLRAAGAPLAPEGPSQHPLRPPYTHQHAAAPSSLFAQVLVPWSQPLPCVSTTSID